MAAQSQQTQVFMEGWLYREESVEGSMTTWKKRWNVLTLEKLHCYKRETETEPISSLSVAAIEEMAYGANIGDKTRTFAFSLTTPRGIVKLAAESEKLREDWVSTLRALVPKAKVEQAKEMLIRKAKRKANLELAQQQIKEAIESILRDSKRVAVRGGFKTYADALAECFQGLLKSVDLVSENGLNSAKSCAYSISSIVDAANSAAAICTNKAIQDEIVVRTRDIAVETANLLGYATTAAHDSVARVKMQECIESIQEQVQQILELLAAAGRLQQELDDAKFEIERALEAQMNPTPQLRGESSVEASVDTISDRAKVLSTTIKNIANNACVTPERVGQYSKQAAQLMCEILDATNIIASCNGVDINDPEYLAGISDISEHKKQQIETLLAAAKGFAAATTNMIDLLKQIPNQEDDENLQFRLSMATRSTDNALNAFMNATNNLDTEPVAAKKQNTSYDFDYSAYSNRAPVADAEKELLAALDAIEQSVSRLSTVKAQQMNANGGKSPRNGPGSQNLKAMGNINVPQNTGASEPVIIAAQKMGEATKRLMLAAADAQKEIKQHDGDTYRKDPNWTSGLVSAAQSIAETTSQLVDVACNPNATPEELVAAARCVNGATARLVAFTRAKCDPNSESYKLLEEASRSIAKMSNQLVAAAKAQKSEELAASNDAEINSLKNAPRTKQIKSEFEAQSKIAKLETDLDAARQYLFNLRRAVYGSGSEDSSVGVKKQAPAPVNRQGSMPSPNARTASPQRGAPMNRGGPAQRGGPVGPKPGVPGARPMPSTPNRGSPMSRGAPTR